MSDQNIRCPKCGADIPLTEAFTHQIEEQLRRSFDADLKRQQQAYESVLRAKDKATADALAQERTRLQEQAKKQAADTVAVELKDLRDQLAEQKKNLDDARQRELDLRKRQREVEDREKNLELEAARKLDAERKTIWDQAAARAAEEHQLKLKERELELDRLRTKIEELQHKAELGSQERQGEAQELVLEEMLQVAFKHDTITAVAKGKKGADVLQKVMSTTGQEVGSILWESKRTQKWGSDWIAKLKDDQRAAKVTIAVIVSEALPDGITTIGRVDGVWICGFNSFIGLAMALRHQLIEVSLARSALTGQQGKMELLYNYLSGPQFRQRVETMIEGFLSMKKDLTSERIAMEKIWGKREKQIERVLQNTAGMHGDLQGIIGDTLPGVKTLELAAVSCEDGAVADGS